MRILIVDDAPNIREILKAIVAIDGWDAVEAATGAEAVRLYRQTRPDLVLMDVDMPQLNGLEAARVIKRQDPHARLVMVTARGERQTVAQAFEIGIAGFLVKPFEPLKVLQLVRYLASQGAAAV